MSKLGFNMEKDFLPSFDKFQSNTTQRLMFLKLFNQQVCSHLMFSKEEMKACKKEKLFDIFIRKIIDNLKFDSYVNSRIKIIDIEKTKKINAFIEKIEFSNKKSFSRFSLKDSLFEANIDTAYSLIKALEENHFSFYLDTEKTFKKFVSNKILKNKDGREIIINNDSIDIESKEKDFKTKIFTFWEFLDSNNLQIDNHIKKAVECIENTDFKQVYLVYPKNENFNRHIKIQCDDIRCDEYVIKLIPYSLRSILR